jgi:hypothetical protein
MPPPAAAVWAQLTERLTDPTVVDDARRARQVIDDRHRGATWAERVAGRMAHRYRALLHGSR